MAEKKKNVSSGAEKAEKLALANKDGSGKKKSAKSGSTTKSVTKKTEKKTPVKSEKKTGAKSEKNTVKSKKSKKGESKRSILRAERREKRKEKRLARAQLNAEKKQARLERKLEHKEKKAERIALMKERKAERRAQKAERRELLKSESREARQSRIAEEKKAKIEARKEKRKAYLAEKKAKREHALKVRAEKRAARSDKQRTPGIGGWIAAVTTLGVTTLALGTVVTFGWLTMDNMQADMASGYSRSLYELNAIVDNLDADLSRAQASTSVNDRVRVLSDIAIESEAAEIILERFPLDIQMTEQLSSFVNKMGDSAKGMLYTVANGGELSLSQIKSLDYMYETNSRIKEELNRLVGECDSKDLLNAMRGKSGMLSDGFTNIQNNTFEEPKGIQDGPFADSLKTTNPAALKGLKEITAQKAEELAMKYFADYKVSAANCTGEAVAKQLTVYNVVLTIPDGEMLVQLSKLGGKVVSFDSYKDCSDKNFSVDRCIAIAEDFLDSIGYGHLKAVWSSENGTTCNLNFAPVQNGAILYPDLVKVKVCEERGIVTGVEALAYVLNHGEREIGGASISKEQAQSHINGNLEVTSARKALIPFDGEEVLCYEFYGTLNGRDYYVYVDATTGEEIEVLTIIGTAQGKSIM